MKAFENHLTESNPKWFAVRTRYKREKLVLRALQSKGIEVYLPLNRVTRRWTRKTRVVDLPLINCYVFVRILKKDYVPVLDTENVVDFVRFSKNLISIPDNEIHLMKRIVGEAENIEVEETILEEGDQVVVIYGNLTGLEGTLVERGSKKRLKVRLEMLGHSLLMDMSSDHVLKATSLPA